MGLAFLLQNRVFVGTLTMLIMTLGLFLGDVTATFAQDSESVAETDAEVSVVPELEAVVVTGTVDSNAIGQSVLDKERISSLPAGGGSVEELLVLMPGVQASDASSTSFQAGEILPPLLSISGGRPYDNYFLIDGIGNNSLLDPGSDVPAGSPIDVPGNPQEIFLNLHLIKEVRVYDNNIPSRYGGFAGGVVDVETIDPAPTLSGAVRYRTTRDSWTEFHIDPADQAAFEGSFTEARQPRFEKQDVGFDLNLPLTEHSGLLASYQVLYSKIPLMHFNQTENQTRKSENFLLKYVNHFTGQRKLTVQALYNPYAGEYFLNRTKDSSFTLKGGGAQLSTEYEQLYGQGHLIINAGLSFSENSRTAPAHHRNWRATASKDWGTSVGLTSSREGGYGNIDKTQKSVEANVDWLSDIVDFAGLIHQINSGLQINLVQANFKRDSTSYAYKKSVLGPIICGPDTFACDDTPTSEQYLSERNVYQAIDLDANIAQLAIYFDDTINFKNLELRPGVRVSYDDFMENTNIAPRFSAKYGLFSNNQTELIAGWNRYYTKTLLTYKLREAIIPLVQQRSSVVDNNAEWTDKASIWPGAYEYSKLKTPFTDEIVLGVNQGIWGGRLDLRYVRRDGYDEFAREKDPFDFSNFNATLYSRLNNNGESHYESYRLFWERQWVQQYLSLNATYSEATSSNSSYEDRLEPADFNPDDRVWYEGKLLYPDELPRSDFNRAWVATLLYSVNLPKGLMFTNTTSFRSGYRNIEDGGGDILVNGILHAVYAEVKRPSSTIFDWRVDWVPPAIPKRALTLTLEIYNLFNKRTYVGAATDRYELGRQFWAGVEYSF